VFVPSGKAFTGDVLSAWASTVPNIDGVTSTNEWNDAAKVTFTLVSQSLESHSATIYEKNDETYMYLAVRVVKRALNERTTRISEKAYSGTLETFAPF
jgi:hypothetical protein